MKKQCKRKVRDPAGWIKSMRSIPSQDQNDLGVAYHSALAAMRSGNGTEVEWSTVTCALNIAIVLAESGIGSNYESAIKEGLGAMQSCKERALKSGRWLFYGTGMTAVTTAVSMHDEQIANATKGEIQRALAEVYRRLGE